MASPAAAGPPLSDDERAELARLRRQAAEWSRHRPRAGRWTASILLLTLAAVLSAASVATIFVRAELLDTDRYVATVAPLVDEPAVQEEVAQLLTREIATAVDLPTRLQQLADEAEELGAPELLDALVTPAANGIESFLRTEIRAIMATDEFARVWDAANRAAHDELVALLTTGRGEFLTADGNQVYLDIGAVVTMVRQQLIQAGFTLAEEIPDDLSIRYPVFQSDALPQLRTAAYLLNLARWLLPILAVALLVGGVLAAPDRRRGLLSAAALVGAGALLLLGALAVGRTFYLDHLPAEIQSRQAASVAYDTILRFLAEALRTLVTVAVVVLVASWLAGPGRTQRWIRRQVSRGLDAAAGGLGELGLSPGIPRFFRAHRQAIDVGVVVIAVGALVLWRDPGVDGTLWLTVVVLLALGLVELLARAPAASPQPTGAR